MFKKHKDSSRLLDRRVRIVIGVAHPKQVHIFKNLADILSNNDYKVRFIAFDKDCVVDLLQSYGLAHTVVGKSGRGFWGKVFRSPWHQIQWLWFTLQFKPDIFLGRMLPQHAIASCLTRKPLLVFEDSESAGLMHFIVTRFADVICTPSCFTKDFGDKQFRYNGYDELIYLHPKYFNPDPFVLEEAGIPQDQKFVVLRFVSWQSSHDIRQHGLNIYAKHKLVQEIEKHAHVYISSETPLPKEFELYKITVPPEKIHHLLYYASLLVGDSQTMTTEAAVLGTPAVRCNSFVGPNDMGNFIELEHEYDLIYSFQESEQAINKALELIQQPNLKEEWAKKRQNLLSHKIDVTELMVDFIENYPASFQKYKEGATR